MTTQTYKVPTINLSRLQDEIDRLNRRAEKLGCKPIQLEVLRTFKEKRPHPLFETEVDFSYSDIIVSGESPQLNGWTMIAAIDPQPSGENIIREVPGQSCPASFRTTDTTCDHCHTKRRRTSIFVLRHENGEYKQVGRNCLGDFLGHQSPEDLIARAEVLFNLLSVVSDADNAEWANSGRGEFVVDIVEFVSVVVALSRRLGWMPKTKAIPPDRATSEIAWDLCAYPGSEYTKDLIREKKIFVSENDVQIATKAIEWAKTITNAPNSYLHDLGVCCRQDFVRVKLAGYTASVVAAYDKETGQREKKTKPTSKHVGTEKSRQIFTDLTITTVYPYSSGIYTKTLVAFKDADGNVLVWKASGTPEWPERNKVVTIKATIKKHDYYKETAQTVLERVVPLPKEEGNESSEATVTADVEAVGV